MKRECVSNCRQIQDEVCIFGHILIARKVVPPARFQRATFRLGVGFTSVLFSTVTKKLNKNAVHTLHTVLEVLKL